jgi:hypothetical protein
MKWSEVSFLRKQESRLLWHVPVELDSKWGLGHMESADVLDSRFRTSPTPPLSPGPASGIASARLASPARGEAAEGFGPPCMSLPRKWESSFFPDSCLRRNDTVGFLTWLKATG